MVGERGAAVVAVIEDDEVERRAFEPALFDSAETYLASPPDHTHCLIIDVHLTGMSGIDLQQKLRAEESTVPVIIMTGNRSDVIRERAERMGCAAFLRKPVNANAILELLGTIPRRPHA
jgi:FixJ family two-component response regulator